ncbi:MAG: alpha/beta hydrolase [Pontixanthobacter sp.]
MTNVVQSHDRYRGCNWFSKIALMVLIRRLAGALALPFALLACSTPATEPVEAHLASPIDTPPARISPRLIMYKSTPHRNLFVHIFQPDARAFPGKRPAILFFHGGGWVEGNAERFYDQAQHLSELGMVAISADYRIKTIDGTAPDAALADAISAMRFVRKNADVLAIDPERIAAGGGSAGGQLAAALATVDGFDDPLDDLEVSKRPSALVLFNPVIDNGPEGYGHDRVVDYWERFSPIHNIRPGHPPTVILLGTADQLIPVVTGKTYCEKVRAVGAECRLHLYEGQPHAFFNQRRSKVYYQKTLDAMDEFLRSIGYLDPK